MASYSVHKLHTKGVLEGLTTKEITSIKFECGKDYGDYTVTHVKELKPNDTVQVEGNRPWTQGGGHAFASYTFEEGKKLAQYWRSQGYTNVHMWAD